MISQRTSDEVIMVAGDEVIMDDERVSFVSVAGRW